MILSARFLSGYTGPNSWHRRQQLAEFTAGQPQDIYLQLADLSLDQDQQPLSGRRYCPAPGAILTVTVADINPAQQVVRVASMAAPTHDTSIFRLQLMAGDVVNPGTRTLLLSLVEGAVTTRGVVHQGLRVQGYNTDC